MKLSGRARGISPSPTLSVDARAKELAAAGERIINFGVGEPDFDTPEHIKAAAAEAMARGMTKYTAVAGTLELRQAICRKFARDNDLTYRPDEIVVSCGAKHSLYNAVQVLAEPGDEVIVPAPYWVSYLEQVKLAGAEPVVVKTRAENGYKLIPEELSGSLTPRSRLLILNSPSNPTGSIYTKEELAAIAEVAVRAGIWVLSDEVYEKLIYDGAAHFSIASLGPEIKQQTVVVNGVSKSYAMTGWRIGYAAAPAPVAKAMADLQSHSTSNPTSIAQAAAVAALNGPQEAVAEMRSAFAARRTYILERLNGIPGINCPTPAGAFYAFPDVSAYFGRRWGEKTISSASDLAAFLLEEAKVAVVPGIAFGNDRCLRFSYAASLEEIAEGMDRIAAAFGSLR
ncbi:MAG TPA: pyridoxal phosphate-dependent aminotransferase [Desulfotomaculum sp.]|nr:pyridoxal phosphate-dependent aminotransferase [Desulfotomaculum sp.]